MSDKSMMCGDVAKLREALATIRKRLVAAYESEAGFMRYSPNKPLVDLIDAALAAPPRNCDEYSADELKVKFNSELDSELPMANNHEKNLVRITAMEVIDTLLAPTMDKEGGAK